MMADAPSSKPSNVDAPSRGSANDQARRTATCERAFRPAASKSANSFEPHAPGGHAHRFIVVAAQLQGDGRCGHQCVAFAQLGRSRVELVEVGDERAVAAPPNEACAAVDVFGQGAGSGWRELCGVGDKHDARAAQRCGVERGRVRVSRGQVVQVAAARRQGAHEVVAVRADPFGVGVGHDDDGHAHRRLEDGVDRIVRVEVVLRCECERALVKSAALDAAVENDVA